MKKFAFFSLVFFIFSIYGYSCGEKCPMHGKELLKKEEGTVKGTIICLHCKLEKGEKCQAVIETEDGKIFEFCSHSLKDKKINPHSMMKVEVSGKISYPKEGNPVIDVMDLKEVK